MLLVEAPDHEQRNATDIRTQLFEAQGVSPEAAGHWMLIQAAVPVLPGDTEASLSARVLVQEHQIYPRAVRWMVEDQLRIVDGRVVHLAGEAQVQFGLA